ncbi:MAG: hypothetical protein LUD39_05280 [Opitutae bacterium]|nr:hypothetical protein [Opitutae bacterium]
MVAQNFKPQAGQKKMRFFRAGSVVRIWVGGERGLVVKVGLVVATTSRAVREILPWHFVAATNPTTATN